MSMLQSLKGLVRLGGTPTGIAGGFCLGLSLSLVPIPFAGMLVALAVAPALRFNLPATYVGTAIVNPLTGAAFYFAELWLGLTLTGQPVPPWNVVKSLDARGWARLALDWAGPFGLGVGVFVTASSAVTFPMLWLLVRRFQRRAENSR